MDVKTITLEVNIPNALAADTVREGNVSAGNKDYPWCLGVWIKTITNPGGNSYLSAGVSDNTQGDILELAPSEVYYADSAVKNYDKFFPIKVPNDGRTFKGKVRNPALTTDALGKVVFVFLVSKTEEIDPGLMSQLSKRI